MMDFHLQKKERIQHADLSRKGSIDEFIVETVHCLNTFPSYSTTSSCSGRIIIFESSEKKESTDPSQSTTHKIAKKGCKWLCVSHNRIDMETVTESLLKVTNDAVFKFEPMIMHVQCESLQDAQNLHHAAVAAGFRNSGISIGNKGKIMVAVRSTHGLEVPLSKDGNMLVTKEYLSFLVDCANQKMDENFSRIDRFMEEVKALTERSNSSCDAFKSHQKDKAKAALVDEKKRQNMVHQNEFQKKDEDLYDQDLSLFVFDNT